MIAFTTLIRRTAATLGAIAALTVTGIATSQTVTLTGSSGNSCSYSEMRVLPNGNVEVTCGSSSSPGTFNLTAPTSLATGITTTTQVRVNRAGGTAGSVDVPVAVSGVCSSSVSSVTFASGSATSQNVAIDTGSSEGSCMVSLGTPSAGSPGTPSSRTIAIVDSNAPVVFEFQSDSSAANVGGGAVPITVTRSGGSANAWSVPVSISPTGVATLSPPSTLNFPANSASAQVFFNPPSTSPGSLPQTFTVSLGTPTDPNPTDSQTGSIGAQGTHAVTLNGPAAGCPAPTTVQDLGAQGNLTTTRLPTGVIATFELPKPTGVKTTGIFKLSETSSTWPGYPNNTPWNYEIHINKCPGLIQEDPNDACYVKSANKTLLSKVYFTKALTGRYATEALIEASNYCFAPATEGTWYVNIRYTYSQCGTAGTCAWQAQWTNWSY